MWRDAGYVDALSSVRRCVLLDHRGHGRSEQPPLAQAHTMERYAADVVDVLDDLAIERIAFWGYSQGGEIGLALAALHPSRIVALITTGVISSPDRRANSAEDTDGIRAIRHGGWAGFLDPAALSSMPAWFQRQVQATNRKCWPSGLRHMPTGIRGIDCPRWRFRSSCSSVSSRIQNIGTLGLPSSHPTRDWFALQASTIWEPTSDPTWSCRSPRNSSTALDLPSSFRAEPFVNVDHLCPNGGTRRRPRYVRGRFEPAPLMP